MTNEKGLPLQSLPQGVAINGSTVTVDLRLDPPRGEYTCNLTSTAGVDTETTRITDCSELLVYIYSYNKLCVD